MLGSSSNFIIDPKMTRIHIIWLILGLVAGIVNLAGHKWEVAAWAFFATLLLVENAMLYRQAEVERAMEPWRSSRVTDG